ncbi:hypothetical protein Pint_00741 [Pistacia integerrima]|uniref:Uncharacterized protein n=1 Tax=Pistacia integerrima TaxID=434235 RepID=A0ACC0ZQ20_9ROSI|nr:hypothetical protein Pint_00741 [Pistacia integerrima]
MASDESMNFVSSTQEDEYDDTDDGFYHQHQVPHNLSRLSMCKSSMYMNEDEDDDNDERMRMSMTRLSIESFDGDADEEFSDDKDFKGLGELSSDSEKEPECYSLPATPPRRRNRSSIGQQFIGVKDYASENEVQKGVLKQKIKRNLRRRKIIRERWVDVKFNKKDEEENFMNNYGNNSLSGESEGGGSGGGGVVVITRPKGGRRSLCMDMEEMKACRDLGFELEHERMLEMPNRVSLSGSTLDTSSGGNSPIAQWRISSPGDDPRDVKARLKVWAQAVALASTSRHSA